MRHTRKIGLSVSALALLTLTATGCSGGAAAKTSAAATPQPVTGQTISGTVAEQWATGEEGFGEPPTTPPPGFGQDLLDLAVTEAQAHLRAANLDEGRPEQVVVRAMAVAARASLVLAHNLKTECLTVTGDCCLVLRTCRNGARHGGGQGLPCRHGR